MRIQSVALALIAAVALSAPAHAEIIALEEAVETSTNQTTLPGSDKGVIVAKLCPSCALSVLRLTTGTSFLVGKTTVSFVQLKKFVNTTESHSMVVLYDKRQKTVTRVIVQGQLPAVKR
jgi:hypothetical protein